MQAQNTTPSWGCAMELFLQSKHTMDYIRTLCGRLDEPMTVQVLYDDKSSIGSKECALYERAISFLPLLEATVRKWKPSHEKGSSASIVYHGALFDHNGSPTNLYDQLA